MPLVSFIKFKSYLITSSRLFSSRPPHILHSRRLIISHLLIDTFTVFHLTWLNYLSLVSLVLSSVVTTSTFPSITACNSSQYRIITHPSHHFHSRPRLDGCGLFFDIYTTTTTITTPSVIPLTRGLGKSKGR